MRAAILIALLGVSGAAALDLGVALRGDLSRPSDAEWAAAVAAVRAEQKPGDVLVHSPLFTVRELAALGDLRARPDVPAPAIRATRRVLVLDRADHPIFGLGEAATTRALAGGLELRIHLPVSGQEAPLFQLLESLGPDTMRVERPDRTTRCDRRRAEGGFDCPGEPDWLYAAPRTLRIGGQDAECVWAHPTTDGAVVLAIPPQASPPTGRRLLLRVRAGLVDDAVTGTPDGAPVRVELVQAGRARESLMVPNVVGWRSAEAALDAEVTAELRVTAPRDGRRHFCLDAQVVEVAQ
jgi:hypothetical protein